MRLGVEGGRRLTMRMVYVCVQYFEGWALLGDGLWAVVWRDFRVEDCGAFVLVKLDRGWLHNHAQFGKATLRQPQRILPRHRHGLCSPSRISSKIGFQILIFKLLLLVECVDTHKNTV